MSILRLFREGQRLNVHPSLVPLYRGPAPIQHAIADDVDLTGVTILSINPFKYGVDTGDIWAARAIVSILHFLVFRFLSLDKKDSCRRYPQMQLLIPSVIH